MGSTRRYSPEVRDRAVRMVFDQEFQHDSQWAAMCSISAKIGCSAETLRNWVRQAERDAGRRPGLTTEERQRLKELEREIASSSEPTRSCVWHRRISLRRSSTADRDANVVHRHAPR